MDDSHLNSHLGISGGLIQASFCLKHWPKKWRSSQFSLPESWYLSKKRHILSKNKLVLLGICLKTHGKVRFLRLELDIGRAIFSKYECLVLCQFDTSSCMYLRKLSIMNHLIPIEIPIGISIRNLLEFHSHLFWRNIGRSKA